MVCKNIWCNKRNLKRIPRFNNATGQERNQSNKKWGNKELQNGVIEPRQVFNTYLRINSIYFWCIFKNISGFDQLNFKSFLIWNNFRFTKSYKYRSHASNDYVLSNYHTKSKTGKLIGTICHIGRFT